MGKYEDDWMSRAVDITDQENQAPANDDWMSRAVDITDQENQAKQENPAKPDVSGTESFIRGAAQEGTFNTADELTAAFEAVKDWYRNDPMSFKEAYNTHLDESRLKYQQAQEANPGKYLAGQATGGLALSLAPGLNVAKGASFGKAALNAGLQGAASAFGASEADNAGDLLEDVTKGAAISGALGGTLHKLTGQGMEDIADDLTMKATGATGTQVGRMRDGTAKMLRKEGIIEIGSDPAAIAKNAEQALENKGRALGDFYNQASDMGVTADLGTVVSKLRSEIDKIKGINGKEAIVGQLEKTIADIGELSKNGSTVPLKIAEASKKAFQDATNYNAPKFEQEASAIIARVYKETVDDVVDKIDPNMFGSNVAPAYTRVKDSYGKLVPVAEAARKRADTMAQSPIGGFGDLVALGVGGIGGIPGAAATLGAKRLVVPRLPATGAILAQGVADVLNKSPESFGKFAPILKSAAARGTSSLTATHHMLQQTSEEYRNLLREGEDGQQ